MHSVDFLRASFIVSGLAIAGVAHVLWISSPRLCRLNLPLDGGRTVRGRRLFGANKTLGGLLIMPTAGALGFPALAAAVSLFFPAWSKALWPLTHVQFSSLGCSCGLVFMLAELPNSLLKRQLDIAPGELPRQHWLRPICLLGDRLDSTIGVLLWLSLIVGASAAVWFWALLLGPGVHAAFSFWLKRAGVKSRVL